MSFIYFHGIILLETSYTDQVGRTSMEMFTSCMLFRELDFEETAGFTADFRERSSAGLTADFRGDCVLPTDRCPGDIRDVG